MSTCSFWRITVQHFLSLALNSFLYFIIVIPEVTSFSLFFFLSHTSIWVQESYALCIYLSLPSVHITRRATRHSAPFHCLLTHLLISLFTEISNICPTSSLPLNVHLVTACTIRLLPLFSQKLEIISSICILESANISREINFYLFSSFPSRASFLFWLMFFEEFLIKSLIIVVNYYLFVLSNY